MTDIEICHSNVYYPPILHAGIHHDTPHPGSIGPPVSALGRGRMGMSGRHGEACHGEGTAIAHAAPDPGGASLPDSGDFHGPDDDEPPPDVAAGERHPTALTAMFVGGR